MLRALIYYSGVSLLIFYLFVIVLLPWKCHSTDPWPLAGSWNIFTTIILLNILISLFSSAYSDVTDDAAANYLAFFASKLDSALRIHLPRSTFSNFRQDDRYDSGA